MASSARLLIGGGLSGGLWLIDFDGTSFNVVNHFKELGTMPSWQLFRRKTTQLYSVDEGSDQTRLFHLDPLSGDLKLVQNATGSKGVVFLEFNLDGTRMAGAAYEQGTIDFWDVSSSSGRLELIKTIEVPGDVGPRKDRQESAHPHQILLEPSGRFYVCPDLGTDRILVIDGDQDAFRICGSFKVPTPGSGPRHGVFFPANSDKPSHYFLLCELKNLIEVFTISYTGDGLDFSHQQTVSTFGKTLPPAAPDKACAGCIQLAPNNEDLYVSNRLTGNATDSIMHFKVVQDEDCSATLVLSDGVSSRGILPRTFCLGKDNFSNVIFSTNQQGECGLVAFNTSTNGDLGNEHIASLSLATFAEPNSCDGPKFVQQLSASDWPATVQGGQ